MPQFKLSSPPLRLLSITIISIKRCGLPRRKSLVHHQVQLWPPLCPAGKLIPGSNLCSQFILVLVFIPYLWKGGCTKSDEEGHTSGTGQGTKTDVKLVLTIHTSASFHTVHKVVLGYRAHAGAKMCWQYQLPLTPLDSANSYLTQVHTTILRRSQE